MSAVRGVIAFVGAIAFWVTGAYTDDAGLVAAGSAMLLIAATNFDLWSER